MDNKKYHNLKDPRDVEYLFHIISDDMVLSSNAGRNTGADDDIPLSRLTFKINKNKKLKTVEDDSIIAGNISISKWKNRDKKAVSVLNTMHNPAKITYVLGTQKNGSREPVTCPESVAGVDHFDQLLSIYSIPWKSSSGRTKPASLSQLGPGCVMLGNIFLPKEADEDAVILAQ
ncbi:hypothetical protein ILUMI_15943 [Ignelater luminosus]|uniref:Uncharacterized protein n=1 Tax=Ignelater luminosus TaxID=2038154 RepID=A0A8K0CVF2_IGNLU|nr:hypothetical protein ILUMI_15943 [Ignelater luminosus]